MPQSDSPQQQPDRRSTREADSGFSWAGGTVIAPDPAAAGRALVTNAPGGHRLGIGRGALVEALATAAGNGADALRRRGLGADQPTQPDPGTALWREHGWHHALDTYLWSRQATFVDNGAGFRDRQAEVLQEYLHRDGPPPGPRRLTDGSRALPAAGPLPETPLGELLRSRVTARTMQDRQIALTDLSDVLAHGLRGASRHRDPDPADPRRYLHSFGSAFDYYLASYRVGEMDPGIYLYQPEGHRFSPVSTGWRTDALRETCQRVLIGQSLVRHAAATIFVVADFPRYQWRYRHERALRNLYFDAARVANGFILAATAHRLRNWITPAVRDNEARALLDLVPLDNQVLYTVTIG